MLADELRVAGTWAGVTPPAPAIDPPLLLVQRAGSKVVFFWAINSTGFNLQTVGMLSTNNLWQNAVGTTGSTDSFFTFTNAGTNSVSFFRLYK